MATFLIGLFLMSSLYLLVICPIKQGLKTQIHKKERGFSTETMFFEEIGISESEIKSVHKCSGNFSNQIVIVKFHNGISAIFKPSEGECAHLRKNIKGGTYYRRERAAYLVDKFLGLNIVPPTTIRDIEGKTGSLQLFIEEAKEGINLRFEQQETEIFKDQLLIMWVLDLLISNSDRHVCNWLFLGNRIFAIDNGLSFTEERNLLNSSEQYDEELPESLIEKLEKRINDKIGKNILKELLKKLLSEEEISAFFYRLDYIGKLAMDYKRIPFWAREN
ncbi:MAG: hypothetical protein UT05_C0010G0001 [Parcubacteria group bacterium GW2011_GWF2_38_76]|nr:MAG: hypothetical protein UT05_C0010G0001 [Parcubacteria group bacterium GW2011_GWF2_38_76]HBM45569.1 hypothetical protein [Patescibacteria group bacterium]